MLSRSSRTQNETKQTKAPKTTPNKTKRNTKTHKNKNKTKHRAMTWQAPVYGWKRWINARGDSLVSSQCMHDDSLCAMIKMAPRTRKCGWYQRVLGSADWDLALGVHEEDGRGSWSNSNLISIAGWEAFMVMKVMRTVNGFIGPSMHINLPEKIWPRVLVGS